MDSFVVNVKGIKCDNESCNFKDMSVKYEDYNDWLNKPCPNCGENLLTEKDFNSVKRMKKVAEVLSTIFPSKGGEKVRVPLEMNGLGEIEVVNIDKEE